MHRRSRPARDVGAFVRRSAVPLERGGEEQHLILNRVRPVIPGMSAGPFGVIVRHTQRDESLMQGAVRADQRIVDAAVDRQVDVGLREEAGALDDRIAVPERWMPPVIAEYVIDAG